MRTTRVREARSEGSGSVCFTQDMETQVALSFETIKEKMTHFDPEVYNQFSGTTFERLLQYTGFKIESDTLNDGIREVVFFLDSFWYPDAEVFFGFLATLGVGLKSGFQDFSGSYNWFYRSELYSKKLDVTKYEI